MAQVVVVEKWYSHDYTNNKNDNSSLYFNANDGSNNTSTIGITSKIQSEKNAIINWGS